MSSEAHLLNSILLELGKRKEIRIWRNQVGLAYGFNFVKTLFALLMKRDVVSATNLIKTTRPIHFGVKGQSDIAGIHKSGKSIWIEVKREGNLKGESEFQKAWGRMIVKY